MFQRYVLPPSSGIIPDVYMCLVRSLFFDSVEIQPTIKSLQAFYIRNALYAMFIVVILA
jgi:hypothetical protein